VILGDHGVDQVFLANLAVSVWKAKESGKQIIIVSSWAVGLGKKILRHNTIKWLAKTESGQIFSSVGQTSLMQHYIQFFSPLGITVSQALLTRKDFVDREGYLNMKQVLLRSLEMGIVPIINENDVLSQEELDFSDNDQLGALITGMVGGKALILLSNIDGLYDRFPWGNLIKEVSEITPETFEMACEVKSTFGTWGMASKLTTAKLLLDLGIDMYLANGKNPSSLQEIFAWKNPWTLFHTPLSIKVDSLKKWLKAWAVPTGKLEVSTIISDLLKFWTHASLLEIWVEKILSSFEKWEVVDVCDETGKTIWYGIAKIASSQISKFRDESTKIVIHTDYFIKV